MKFRSQICAIFLSIVAVTGAGCAGDSKVAKVRIVEWSDGNPDHRDFLIGSQREVTISGADAVQVAKKFPELGSKPPAPANHAGNARFEIFVVHSDGTQKMAEVFKNQQSWFEEGNFYSIRPGTMELLEKYIRNAKIETAEQPQQAVAPGSISISERLRNRREAEARQAATHPAN